MAQVECSRCEQHSDAIETAPMGGRLGQTLMEKVCKSCYQDWVQQQVLYINHYGLQMTDPEDRKRLIAAMKEYLGLPVS